MATGEVISKTGAAPLVQVAATTPNYTRPLALVTTLFFMWGFLTSLNDILVPLWLATTPGPVGRRPTPKELRELIFCMVADTPLGERHASMGNC
jgi:hypothetical protein